MVIFEWILIPLVSGVVASLTATLLWWLFYVRIKWAHIKFSNGLRIVSRARMQYGECEIVVRFANLGIFDFEEINIDAKLMIGGSYTYISVGSNNYINRLRGKRYIKNKRKQYGEFMHTLHLHLDEKAFNHFTRKRYEQYQEIYKKAKDHDLTLWDIFKAFPEEAKLTLFVYGYTAITGVRKTFESKTYTFNHIWPYKFAKNSVDISEQIEDIDLEIINKMDDIESNYYDYKTLNQIDNLDLSVVNSFSENLVNIED